MMEGGTKLLPDSILMPLYCRTKQNPLFMVDFSLSALPALVFPPPPHSSHLALPLPGLGTEFRDSLMP